MSGPVAANVEVFTTSTCPYCAAVKSLLQKKGVAFVETGVDTDPEKRAWLIRETGKRTVPQVFINGKSYGGFLDLSALDAQGKLDPLLA